MSQTQSRRDFLAAVARGASATVAAGVGHHLGCPAEAQSSRPNILLVTTDYQAGEDGPSLGLPFLNMPHLDRLCREGLVFDRYYSTSPICIPARYTLITGQYPHTHGAWDNVNAWVPDGSPILMESLREAGYHTTGVGKMHFRPWDRMAGFHRRIIADRKGNGPADNKFLDDYAKMLAARGLTRWDYLQRQSAADIFGVYDWPFDPALHIDAYVGDQSLGVIERGELREPWFLWVSFNGPHNPWDPPAEYTTPYTKMDLPRARTFDSELETKPRDHTRTRYNYTREVVDLLDRDPSRRDDHIRRIRAGHFGGLSFIDHHLGRILAALERRDALAQTAVFFSSDHGCLLGDHGNIHKGIHYERAARVPFVVRWPERVTPGRTDAFAGHVDFMPTVLALAGAPRPRGLEGHDLGPVLFGRTRAVADCAIIETRGATSIVTGQWKLGVNPTDGDGDLYDLSADRDELRNCFGQPAYAAVQRRLTARMAEVNPRLGDELRRPPSPVPQARSVYVLGAGETLEGTAAPYPGGRSVFVRAELGAVQTPGAEAGISGLLLSDLDAWNPHGFALTVVAGRPAFCVRLWKEDLVVMSPTGVGAGPARIDASWRGDGLIELQLDGIVVATGQVRSGFPRQPGHTDAMPRAPLRSGGDGAAFSFAGLAVTGALAGRTCTSTLSFQ